MKNMLWYVLAGLCLAGQAALGQLVPVPHVDTFTGTFSTSVPVVTIPGPHGGGFTVQLTYSSDVKAEEEASIVGYGWSLNIPTITRAKMGFPDDVKEGEVIYQKKNAFKSQTVSIRGNLELLSFDLGKKWTATLGAGLSLCASCSDGVGYDAFATASANLGIGQPTGGNRFGIGASVNTKGLFSSSLSAWGFSSNVFTYNPNSRISPVPFGGYPMEGSVSSGTGTLRLETYETGMGFTSVDIKSRETLPQKFSGYLYTPNLIVDDTKREVAMDYLTERDRAVGIDDPTPLPVPIPAPDKFIVSAPEISGTFRVHHSLPLRFRPAEISSEIKHTITSLKLITGTSIGGGVGMAVPYTTLRTTEYGDLNNDDYKVANPLDNSVKAGYYPQYRLRDEWKWVGMYQPPVFRYEQDPADAVRYTPADEPQASWMLDVNEGMKPEHYHPANMLGQIRTNRAITWRTQGEKSYRNRPYYDIGDEYDKKGAINGLAPNLIGAFTITSESGNQYDFSVPMVSKEEATRTIGTKGLSLNVPNQRVFYKNGGALSEKLADLKRLDYTNHSDAYASSWMIRSITAPNYVDINNNGPDMLDKGAWTLFEYGASKLFDWRSPHNGYMVERGDVDDPEDDQLSYSQGSQYVRNVRIIETATHLAEFVMNTSDPATYPMRKDAYPRWSTDAASQATPSAHVGDNPSEYLVMIRLHAKTGGGGYELLQTVHFQYDYSLMPGNPSSAAGAGKLTLRRIWVENRNVKEPNVNPLTFDYAYPTAIPTGILSARYPAALPLPSGITENPAYDAEDVDAWGYRQGTPPPAYPLEPELDTKVRAPRQTWQTPFDDPAAWRLKAMHLPTGGSIVVGYEARTYTHVQDKPVMVMANVIGATSGYEGFTIDMASVGGSGITYPQALAYAASLREKFIDRGEPVYYDFTYETPACPPLARGYHHTKGYGRLTSCTVDASPPYNISVTFGTAEPFAGAQTWDNVDDVGRHLPVRTTVRQWKTYDRGKCTCDGTASKWDVVELLGSALQYSFSSTESFTGFPSLFVFNDKHSQLRLPAFGNKTGGGVRVKHLLSLSPEGALETSDAAAVGTEYLYDEMLPDGRMVSTGVAMNEPWGMRPENAIVGIDADEWAMVADHVYDTKDMWRAEGPIGLTITPAGSIGYRNVTVRGINRNGNAMPHTVYTYLTARDIPPVDVKKEPVQRHKYDFHDDNIGFYSTSTLDLRLSQSFMIEHRPYHGLLSSVKTYTPPTASGVTSLLNATTYEYTAPGERVLLYDTLTRALRYGRYGDHEDLVMEGRTVREHMHMFNFDFSFEMKGLIPLPGFCPSITHLDHNVRTYTATKILSRAPILRRVISFDRGALDTTETYAYDAITGLPAIYKSHDIHHGSISVKSSPPSNHMGSVHMVTVPAYRAYSAMGQKSIGDRYEFAPWKPLPGIGPMLLALPTITNYFDIGVPGIAAEVADRIAYLRSMFAVGDVLCYKLQQPPGFGGASTDSVFLTITSVADLAGPPAGVRCSVAVVGPGTMPLSGVGVGVFRRVASGRTNQLTSAAGSVVLHGIDDSAILERAGTLDWLSSIARDFTLGTRAGHRYIPFKHANPTYEYRGFQITSPVKKLTSVDWNVADPCTTNVSSYANALTTSFSGGMLWEVKLGISNPNIGLCGCTPNLFTCTAHWLALPGPVPAYQQWTGFDRWKRFMASDEGNLMVATHKPAIGVSPSKVTYHDGMFGCVPTLLVPYASEPCPTGSPKQTRVLSMNAMHYAPRDPTVNLSAVRQRKYEPVTTWSYGTTAVVDGSVASSYAQTGAFPITGAAPAMWSAWATSAGSIASAPSTSNHQGWTRSALVTLRSADGIPLETISARGYTSALILSPDGFTPRVVLNRVQYGEGYASDFENGCLTCTGKPHTGTKAARLSGAFGSPTSTTTVTSPASPTVTVPATRPLRVQFWVRPTDSLSSVQIRNNLKVNGYAVVTDDSVACVHGWRLYDITLPYSTVGASVTFAAQGGNDFLVDDVSISDPAGGKTMIVRDAEYRTMAVLGSDHLPVRAQYDARGTLAKTVAVTEHGWLAERYSDGHLPEWSRTASLQFGGPNYMNLMMPFDPLRGMDGWKAQRPKLSPQMQKMQGKGTILDTKIDADGIRTTSPLQKFIPKTDTNKDTHDGNIENEVQR